MFTSKTFANWSVAALKISFSRLFLVTILRLFHSVLKEIYLAVSVFSIKIDHSTQSLDPEALDGRLSTGIIAISVHGFNGYAMA